MLLALLVVASLAGAGLDAVGAQPARSLAAAAGPGPRAACGEPASTCPTARRRARSPRVSQRVSAKRAPSRWQTGCCKLEAQRYARRRRPAAWPRCGANSERLAWPALMPPVLLAASPPCTVGRCDAIFHALPAAARRPAAPRKTPPGRSEAHRPARRCPTPAATTRCAGPTTWRAARPRPRLGARDHRPRAVPAQRRRG